MFVFGCVCLAITHWYSFERLPNNRTFSIGGFQNFSNVHDQLDFNFRGNDWRVHLKCHMNIRDHVCPFCSARFSTKGGLGEHIKRHQGEKNYSCSYCDAKFVNKSGLTRHMGTHDHVGRLIMKDFGDRR